MTSGSRSYWEAPDMTKLVIVDQGLFEDLPMVHPNGSVVRAATQSKKLPGTSGTRRTARQAADVDAGRNPLTRQPQHPAAPTDATRMDRFPRPYTCGTCRFAVKLTAGNKHFTKCGYVDPDLPPSPVGPRVTGSVASDLRDWWPGCPDHQPAEG